MSINFYQTMLLFVFYLCFLSPIKVQAYCHFQECGVSSNLEEVPLTVQEAQEIKNFYMSVERDLSENLEVLQDGTHRVTFSENVNVLFGMGIATEASRVDRIRRINRINSLNEVDYNNRVERIRRINRIARKTFIENHQFLEDFFKDKPHTSMNFNSSSMRVEVGDPRGKYRLLIKRSFGGGVLVNETAHVIFFRKINGVWVEGSKRLKFLLADLDETYKTRDMRKLKILMASLQADDPQVFEKYLKTRKVSFTGIMIKNRILRAGKFVGRGWPLQAILAGAGIVGGQLLFDYAQENHPEEEELVINITKEQWETLSTNVRGIIEDFSSQTILDELEL